MAADQLVALHRLRCHMRFTASSGLATWARDNMAVRYDQAVHVNEGLVNEEPKRNEVTEDGGRQGFACDLPLLDEAHAQDAFATLSDATVLGQSEPIPTVEGDSRPSWVQRHTCDHEDDVRGGCVVDEFAEGPS